MALGRKIMVIDGNSFVAGASTSAELPDAGFSPTTTMAQLTNVPGVFFQPAAAVDASTNLVGDLIASSEDPLFLGADRVFVDDEGNYYTWNGTALTLARTDATNPSGYSFGTTDMNAFDGSIFTTTSTTVVKWVVDSVFTDNFITGLTSGVRHPLLTYENNQYIGNGNVLRRMTSASDSTAATVLTLSAGQNIVALGIDPGSGKMLISTVQGANASNTRVATAKVLYYNGFSNKVDKVVQVETMVTAFPTSEGGLYAAYGNNLGLWNGSGISFLRQFNDITNNSDQLLYKQHFANIGSTLYLIARKTIWAHGPVKMGGPKVFYPALYNNQLGNARDMTHVAAIGNNKLGFAFNEGGVNPEKFYTFDTTSVSTSPTLGTSLLSNENSLEDFNDGVWLRRAKVYFYNSVANTISPGTIEFYSSGGIINTIGNGGSFQLINNSGDAAYIKEIDIGGGTGTRVYDLRVGLTLNTVNPGIRKIEIFADPANQK